jgi:2-keto-4-pentenoate hydratase/2-oxohepta-3-ene-1,7-dioic acid hydratase in catechol pathway
MIIGRYLLDGEERFARVDSEASQLRLIRDPMLTGRIEETGEVRAASSATLLAPCQPRIIIAAAVNYRSHAIKRAPTDKPELFFKPPTSVIGSGDRVLLPYDARAVEAEGELVVVIGREAKRVSRDDALDFVLGVTCGIDVSAREWQRSDRQFWRAKGCDTFSPIGPFISTEIADSHHLTTRVDGEVRQETETSELLFGIAELVSFASQFMTLRPGDALFTGTPGTTPGIEDGQTVEVEISRIGSLVNPVVREPQPSPEKS